MPKRDAVELEIVNIGDNVSTAPSYMDRSL